MYSPKIREDLISEIYKLSKEMKKPMTLVVDELLRMAIKKVKGGSYEYQNMDRSGRKTRGSNCRQQKAN